MDENETKRKSVKLLREPQHWKIVSVQECPVPKSLRWCDTPEKAVEYWRLHIEGHPFFDPERECFALLLLNAKVRVRGHHLVSIGSLNESIAHPRDVYRAAVIGGAHSIVIMHNHPSGEPEPSDADKRCTQRLQEAGKVLGVELIDHVIVGVGRYHSFREAGTI